MTPVEEAVVVVRGGNVLGVDVTVDAVVSELVDDGFALVEVDIDVSDWLPLEPHPASNVSARAIGAARLMATRSDEPG